MSYFVTFIIIVATFVVTPKNKKGNPQQAQNI